MRFRKTAAIIAATTTTLVLAVGCSDDGQDSGSDAGTSSVQSSGEIGRAAPPSIAADRDGAALDMAAAPDGAGESYAAPEPAKAAAAPFQAVNVADRLVIRTASMSVEVEDLQRAASTVRGMAGTAGGFVGAESSGDEYSQLTLRIAADRFDKTLDDIAALGEVDRRDLSTDDVTGQVVDLQARISSQRASVGRVQALLDRATTIGEIVQVESELTSRQAELESMEQQAATLGDQVALATVHVELHTDGTEPSKIDEDDEDDGFTSGLSDGWDAMGDATRSVLTVVGAALPFVGVVAVIAAGVLIGLRIRRRPAESSGPAE